MADDIVTRLYDLCICCRCGCEQSCSECEAADEIERLRTLLVHGLTAAYDCECCDLCEQLKAIHKEAVKNGL